MDGDVAKARPHQCQDIGEAHAVAGFVSRATFEDDCSHASSHCSLHDSGVLLPCCTESGTNDILCTAFGSIDSDGWALCTSKQIP